MKYKKLVNFLIGILILLILLEIVILIIQNRRLKAHIIALRKEIPHLIPDDYAPPIEAVNLDGKIEFIDFNNNKKTLLFIQTNSCIPCDKNLIFWRRLSYQLKDKARVLLISLRELKDARNLKSYLKVDIPVYTPKNREKFIRDYRISKFSQTILINGKGKVEWIKTGELDGSDYYELRELIF
ncbi:hypothetical protein NLB65_01265 [Candidatus Aminicenantes bacterium AC-335-B20]|jgi:hypothetical protein|nr:hypothetical protein [SCandidatus Aminicenantes bacterium Aminicenantia_JdfR_composite]MCP2596310.1 hypothetical protein [Candidatus Aminicenantes bacterium AC-335-G13]MCP2599073.1 hypothetical protein [Candidatus Aminicenantes bacterium AC-335-B20]MCP2606405.1 hypothetical protein [Candidatus Aminicenantes bacterium AC-708-I09]MCP2617785.1 hypothetical protein [Candidatus Aminicenantes bacterium AC-335-A11]